MKYKVLLAALCMLLAGAGYCFSREAKAPGDGLSGETVLDFSETEKEPDAETSAEAPALEEKNDVSLELTAQALCYVHICGAVERPGVYELEEGSRMFQAVEAAGGFSEGAAEGYLNMAEPVSDGMKIIVPKEAELQGAERYGMAGEASGSFVQEPAGRQSAGEEPSKKVNLNTASKEELMTLTGIGESRAEDIIRYREDYGPFEKIEDVMQVSGIKDAAFAKIQEDITV